MRQVGRKTSSDDARRAAQHDDAMGERQGFVHVMRDKDHGGAIVVMQMKKMVLHLLTGIPETICQPSSNAAGTISPNGQAARRLRIGYFRPSSVVNELFTSVAPACCRFAPAVSFPLLCKIGPAARIAAFSAGVIVSP